MNERPRRKWLLVALAAVLVGGAMLVAAVVYRSVYCSGGAGGDGSRDVPQPANPDEQLRRLVVGTWEDDYQGKRTMTLRDDGTGTMVVELSGLKAALFAARLQFEMTWAVENGRLKKRTVGGEPAAQVNLILKTMGDRVDESILDLSPERLLLLDQDGKTRYDWRRVEP